MASAQAGRAKQAAASRHGGAAATPATGATAAAADGDRPRGESTLLNSCKVRYKKRVGDLKITERAVTWAAKDMNLDIPVTGISKNLVSKPPHYCISIQADGKSYVFDMEGDTASKEDNLKKIAKCLGRLRGKLLELQQQQQAQQQQAQQDPASHSLHQQQQLQLQQQPDTTPALPPDEVEMRVAVLAKSKADSFLHKALVATRDPVVPDEEFWQLRRAQVRHERVAPERQRKGMRSAMLSDVRPNMQRSTVDSTVVEFSITKDVKQHIFVLFPAVRVLYSRIVATDASKPVPDGKMSEKDFWIMYFTHYYKSRNNAANVAATATLAERAREHDKEFARITSGTIDDLAAPVVPSLSEQKSWMTSLQMCPDQVAPCLPGYGLNAAVAAASRDTVAVGTHSKAARRVLVKRINYHSTLVLQQAGTTPVHISAQLMKAAAVERDLKAPAAPALIPLQVTDAHVPFGVADHAAASAPGHGTGVGARSGSDSSSLARAIAQLGRQPVVLTRALPASQEQARATLDAFNQSVRNTVRDRGQAVFAALSAERRAKLLPIDRRCTELLRHFWRNFNNGTRALDPPKWALVTRLVAQLRSEAAAIRTLLGVAADLSAVEVELWHHIAAKAETAVARFDGASWRGGADVVSRKRLRDGNDDDDDDDDNTPGGAASAVAPKRPRLLKVE